MRPEAIKELSRGTLSSGLPYSAPRDSTSVGATANCVQGLSVLYPQDPLGCLLLPPRRQDPHLAVRRCHHGYAASATETVGFLNPAAISRTRVLESASTAIRARCPCESQFLVPVAEMPLSESNSAAINWIDMRRAPLAFRLFHGS
jgi:hypothetical protein